jgi:hypothetical protein
MKIALTACFAATVAVATASAWSQDLPAVSVESIPAGVPLRVQLEKSYRMRVGTEIEGHLTEPVYLIDHIVLPQDSKVFGSITGKHSVSGRARTAAIFNGDLTPLKEADVTFNEVLTPDGREYQIDTDAAERTTSVVRIASEDQKPPRRSLGGHIAAAFRWTKTQTVAVFQTPHKADAIRQMLYKEVPFHPQEVWVGTQYDAELLKPLDLQEENTPESVPVAPLSELKLSGTIEARLIDSVDSATTKPGTPVEAVLTQPLFEDETPEEVVSTPVASTNSMPADEMPSQVVAHKRHKLVLPEGTHLIGTVVQAKAAGMFGHDGSLRLSFRKVELPQGDVRVVQGQIIAAEGIKAAHIQLDDEGGVKATHVATRFLTPVSLGSLAAVSGHAGGLLQDALTSNGMDAVTEVVGTAISSAALISGFTYYEAGKVVFDQWIGRGHDVVFARNTRIEIALTQHENSVLVSDPQETKTETALNTKTGNPTPDLQQASLELLSPEIPQ